MSADVQLSEPSPGETQWLTVILNYLQSLLTELTHGTVSHGIL